MCRGEPATRGVGDDMAPEARTQAYPLTDEQFERLLRYVDT